MFSCRLKTCPMSLLIRSFYDKVLVQDYVLAGQGIGFSALFFLAVLSALVYTAYAALFLAVLSPEIITEKIVDLPTIEIRNGQIIKPENFFHRFSLGNGVHLTLDTTDADEMIKDPSPNEIYVSKNGVQFVKGSRIELMPLKQLLGTDNVTITTQNVVDFVSKAADDMIFLVPLCVFLFSVPILFFKYIFLVYLLALFSYAATLFSKLSLPFENRMRLAAVSALPVLVFNFICARLFGLFELGIVSGSIVALIYLYFYLSGIPQQIRQDA